MQAVALMKWHSRTVWKVAELWSSAALISVTSPPTPISLYLALKITFKQRIYYNYIHLKIWQIYIVLYKTWRLSNFISHRKLVYLTFKIEVSEQVTNVSVYVSFYKKYVLVLLQNKHITVFDLEKSHNSVLNPQ
jgi:hypothetical protein